MLSSACFAPLISEQPGMFDAMYYISTYSDNTTYQPRDAPRAMTQRIWLAVLLGPFILIIIRTTWLPQPERRGPLAARLLDY